MATVAVPWLADTSSAYPARGGTALKPASSDRNAVISRSGLSPGSRRRKALSTQSLVKDDRGVRLVRAEIPFRAPLRSSPPGTRPERGAESPARGGRQEGPDGGSGVVGQGRDAPALGHRDRQCPPGTVARSGRPQRLAGQGQRVA